MYPRKERMVQNWNFLDHIRPKRPRPCNLFAFTFTTQELNKLF
jgi:hypothetical protein